MMQMLSQPPLLTSSMPAISLTCPHCEKQVQVHLTGVTRSRECPSCGQVLMFQMAEKETQARRKALLMAPETPVEQAQRKRQKRQKGMPAELEGHPFDRMRSDPELLRVRNRLIAGVAAVAALVALATVNYVFWRPVMPKKTNPAPMVEAASPSVEAAAASEEEADRPVLTVQERLEKLKQSGVRDMNVSRRENNRLSGLTNGL